jgi:hypothetical protein
LVALNKGIDLPDGNQRFDEFFEGPVMHAVLRRTQCG